MGKEEKEEWEKKEDRKKRVIIGRLEGYRVNREGREKGENKDRINEG